MARGTKRLFTWLAVLVALFAAGAVLLRRPGAVETGRTDTLSAGSVSPSGSGAPRASSASLGKSAVGSRSFQARDFVGSAACGACHATEATAYDKSHHKQALLLPSSAGVAGRLDGSSFSTPLGKTTHFAKTGVGYGVSGPNAGGTTSTWAIAYAAGVFPLQQYVVATERGKLQTLGVSWDARPAGAGGRRWFHVYGAQGIAPGDELFFTKPAQNWNHVCADCHSTFVERRYDLTKDAFDSRWAELAVGCEACHGPGAEHVRAVKAGKEQGSGSYAGTFTAKLEPSAAWTPSATGSPAPRVQDGLEVEVCAPCHSRRQPIHEGFVAGDPFLDAFEPELLRPDRYYADGQVDGEVYEWGSFRQSRMYAAGVRCSDCHEPHSAELYASGNALCVRCHGRERFDVEAHSHHAGANAPGCVECHMPSKTFMQVDRRRDHSIRIPRPDLSVAFGTPNACDGCHHERSAVWAADRIAGWFPNAKRRPHFVEALARARHGDPGAQQALAALALDGTAPAIARATALERLGAGSNRKSMETLRTALGSSDALVVYGAVLGASELPLDARAPLLASVVEHPLRAIRVAAAKALAPLPLAEVPVEARGALERAFADVESSFAVSASRPETHIEKSAFELARGRADEAEKELETALRLAPCLAEAHLNLADLARGRGDEARAEKEIRTALACAPKNAFAHHALGLWLVRAGKKQQAIASLRRASELLPENARFSYVLAVALAEEGEMGEAVSILGVALETQPNDRQLLATFVDYERQLGHEDVARTAAQRLEALLHD